MSSSFSAEARPHSPTPENWNVDRVVLGTTTASKQFASDRYRDEYRSRQLFKLFKPSRLTVQVASSPQLLPEARWPSVEPMTS